MSASTRSADAAEPVNLTNCDREMIHVPGSIQPFGVLVAVERRGRVEQISANALEWLGIDPHAAVGRPLRDVAGVALAQRCEQLAAQDERRLEFDATVRCAAGECAVVATASAYARGHLLELEKDCPQFHDDYVRLFRHQDALSDQLQQARSSQELMERTARVIADLTGFNRTMVYRFDPSWNGDIIVEEVRGVQPRFLGHHFPHTDIPVQARALYVRNRIRVIPEVGYKPIPLLCDPAAQAPLDLSDALLRSVSPMHIQYLQNMGVGATVVMSLLVDGALWGMLVCHHDGPRDIGPPLRRFCDFAARALSLQLKQHLDAEHDTARRRLCAHVDAIANQHAGSATFIDELASDHARVLEAFGADSLLIALHGRRRVLGASVPDGLEPLLIEALRAREPGPVFTDRVQTLGAQIAACRDWVGGCLWVPLSATGADYLLWLRRERALEVRWAGKPEKVSTPGDTDELSPRRSFDLWVEQVRGSALPWRVPEVAGAEHLAHTLRTKLASDLRVALENEQTLRRLANHDSLTGLPNRRLLMDRIRTAKERAQRRPGEGFALFFIDLDNFKPINDVYGHAVGDAVLKAISGRYQQALRGMDTLARLGGDEFVVVVENIYDEVDAGQVAEKLLQASVAPIHVSDHEHRVNASIGVCFFPTVQGTPEALLRAADQAMYAAKNAGRGSYRVALPPEQS